MLGQLLDKIVEFDRVIVNDDGNKYLGRKYLLHSLRFVLPGVFLHRFFQSDADRELHSHPWNWACAFVLTGGYREERCEGRDGTVTTRVLKPLSFNLIRRETFHRVELLDEERGAWTIFVAGKRRSEVWGFLDRATRAFETWTDRDARMERRLAAQEELRFAWRNRRR